MSRFDVLVVGGGPAGSMASLVLARSGVDVAVVDRSAFPRDKACGDVVGPRGLQLLSDLGMAQPVGRDVGDMLVVGPTGRRVRLPCADGLTYPGHGTAVTRTVFDALLHAAAVDAGATPFVARALEPVEEDGRIVGYRLSTGETLYADFVIGADGATSEVAAAAVSSIPTRSCGALRCARTCHRWWTSRPSSCGSRRPGARSPGMAGSSRGNRAAPMWGSASGLGQIARPVPARCGRCPISSRTCVPSVSSTNRLSCHRVASAAGSRWGSSGPRRHGGGSSWSATPPVCEPDARGGDLPGADEWAGRRGGDPGGAGSRGRAVSIENCGRTPPVSPDHRCAARRTGGPTPGHGGGRGGF